MALHLTPSAVLKTSPSIAHVGRRCCFTPRCVTPTVQRVATAGGGRYQRSRKEFPLLATETETSATEKASEVEEKEWIALIANAEFMLHDVQNESLAEQLREKVRYYGDKEMEVDFFLVPEPQWLDALYPEKAKLVQRPCVALVSPDPVWMRFMKTRLDQVLDIRLGSLQKDEVLKSGGEIPDFEKPEIWRAPYSPYTPGWWKAFYPKPEASHQDSEKEE